MIVLSTSNGNLKATIQIEDFRVNDCYPVWLSDKHLLVCNEILHQFPNADLYEQYLNVFEMPTCKKLCQFKYKVDNYAKMELVQLHSTSNLLYCSYPSEKIHGCFCLAKIPQLCSSSAIQAHSIVNLPLGMKVLGFKVHDDMIYANALSQNERHLLILSISDAQLQLRSCVNLGIHQKHRTFAMRSTYCL